MHCHKCSGEFSWRHQTQNTNSTHHSCLSGLQASVPRDTGRCSRTPPTLSSSQSHLSLVSAASSQAFESMDPELSITHMEFSTNNTLETQAELRGVYAQRVFEVMTDFENYPKMYQDFITASINSNNITFKVGLLEGLGSDTYTMNYEFKTPPESQSYYMTWTIVEPSHYMKECQGSCEIIPTEQGCLIKHDQYVALKGPRFLVKKLEHLLRSSAKDKMHITFEDTFQAAIAQ